MVSGGASVVTNSHVMTLSPGFESYRGQSYALDIIGQTPLGFYADGIAPPDPGAYAIFGTPVQAPCPGTVVSRLDGMPDMTIPQMDRTLLEGNHVLIRCDGGDVHVLLAHLQQGSVLVARDDTVETGQPLAKVGNSGNSSTPHLHIHAQRGAPPEAPISGDPLHFTIGGDYLYRNDRLVLR